MIPHKYQHPPYLCSYDIIIKHALEKSRIQNVVVRPSRTMMTLTNTYKLIRRLGIRWVLRVIRPILLALKDRPNVGQTGEESIRPDGDDLAALDLHNCRFFFAPTVHLSSCI